MKPFAARTHEEMKDVLKHPEDVGPEIHYYMIRGGVDKTNITVWEPGCVGDEYIKSYGHYHVGDLDETYTILEGAGFVIMQWRKHDAGGNTIDDEIEKFVATKVKAGDSVYIPSGAGHYMVNTGTTWLVTKDDSPVNFEEKAAVSMPGHADYSPFKKLHGGAYYCIKSDTGPIFLKNPLYKSIPEISLEH